MSARELRRSVDGLYRVFGRYPLRADVRYCDHCVGPDEVRALHEVDLHDVTAEQLGLLMVNFSTWGDPAYHRHFLPRLLELTADGAMNAWSYATFLPPCLGSWSAGTAEERNAVDRFIAAWWQSTLTTWPARCEPRELLELIDGCGQRVAPYLAVWPTGTSAPAHHLAGLVTDLIVSSHVDSPFWDDIDAWMCSPAPEAILTAAAARTGPVTAQTITASDDLHLYRQLHCAATDADRH
jgi:hypothetical protein